MNNMKINKIITAEELVEKFKNINPAIKVVSWELLKNDDCMKYADICQPIVKIISSNDIWLRLYVDKEYNEISWY